MPGTYYMTLFAAFSVFFFLVVSKPLIKKRKLRQRHQALVAVTCRNSDTMVVDGV